MIFIVHPEKLTIKEGLKFGVVRSVNEFASVINFVTKNLVKKKY